ncbi:hypothetical protein BAUCODRAFT_331275 [Baudoinia panamericana UAMH 10762]|uniref:Uncharacterized protein n=1 Tax=Baudoinia panamericana (strain UAMH 10762) TaxID=717646 RepID=M2MXD5_BAUPA|nr:uncharacterized protein BAUCODRAFT_331275 [Baudoinia panamericana UAMH 10762]EMC90915.1 hypothetical protein BAUCODRAFT_331275 [Baudoinia panamericana UAMH 10762]
MSDRRYHYGTLLAFFINTHTGGNVPPSPAQLVRLLRQSDPPWTPAPTPDADQHGLEVGLKKVLEYGACWKPDKHICLVYAPDGQYAHWDDAAPETAFRAKQGSPHAMWLRSKATTRAQSDTDPKLSGHFSDTVGPLDRDQPRLAQQDLIAATIALYCGAEVEAKVSKATGLLAISQAFLPASAPTTSRPAGISAATGSPLTGWGQAPKSPASTPTRRPDVRIRSCVEADEEGVSAAEHLPDGLPQQDVSVSRSSSQRSILSSGVSSRATSEIGRDAERVRQLQDEVTELKAELHKHQLDQNLYEARIRGLDAQLAAKGAELVDDDKRHRAHLAHVTDEKDKAVERIRDLEAQLKTLHDKRTASEATASSQTAEYVKRIDDLEVRLQSMAAERERNNTRHDAEAPPYEVGQDTIDIEDLQNHITDRDRRIGHLQAKVTRDAQYISNLKADFADLQHWVTKEVSANRKAVAMEAQKWADLQAQALSKWAEEQWQLMGEWWVQRRGLDGAARKESGAQ